MPEAEADETWRIDVDHSQYYRWLPVKADEVQPGDVAVEATWPGFKMVRTVIDEATTSTTNVHVPSLKAQNDDRRAAGLGPRPHHVNLIRHLEDGAWPKHFPLESITAIRCNHSGIEEKLNGHFLEAVE